MADNHLFQKVIISDPAGAGINPYQVFPVHVPLEQVPQPGGLWKFKVSDHQLRIDPPFAPFPRFVQILNDLTLHITPEAKFPIAYADYPELGVNLNWRPSRHRADTVRSDPDDSSIQMKLGETSPRASEDRHDRCHSCLHRIIGHGGR